MKRRNFLATTGAVTTAVLGSGCMSVSGSKQPPSNREVTKISTSVPDSAQFTITPTVVHAPITPDRTAQIKLAVTWNGDDPTTFKFGNAVPFSYPQYSSDSRRVLLIPVDAGVERQNEQMWIPETGEDGLAAPMVSKEVQLNPGETVANTWAVWGNPDEVSYVESGAYSFESSLKLSSSNQPVSWTFSMSITAGDSSD